MSQREPAAATNPAAAEMIEHLAGTGIETVLDRLEAQSPQCRFGLDGTCCRMCQWGPCKITGKKPLGVCGRGLELVAMAGLLRSVAAGASAQTMHAREMVLTLEAITRGEVTLSPKGTGRLRELGNALSVSTPWMAASEATEKVAAALLDDLSRMSEGRTRTLGFAPRERKRVWEKLGVTPRSAALEIVEAMHMTTLGACSDPDELFRQVLRTSLAHVYTGLVPSSVLSDVLFGVPEPIVAEVNYGVLKADHVNVLVHGHSAIMLEKVLEKFASEEIQALAREKGAAGIVIGGMCCTGHESLARYGVPTVTGAMGQELVLGTGAIDAVVVDMQCVLPGMQHVAECFGTEIVTTCHSNRIPGAVHVPFDPEHPQTLDEDAMRVARIAVEAFAKRDRTKMHIPAHTTKVMVGFTRESVVKAFGSGRQLANRIKSGVIRGVVAMVGCTTPKIGFEAGHTAIARELVREGVLVLASGCASHALLNAGLCSTDAAALAGPGLREACEEAGVPPVLTMGSCADNTRIVQIFAQLAHEAYEDLPQMPFVLSGPELANEKTMGQMIGVLAHGVSTVVGFSPQLPIPAVEPGTGLALPADANPVALFFAGAAGAGAAIAGSQQPLAQGLADLVGSRLLVQPDPEKAARLIVELIDDKRERLEWP